ncbi:MAG TPA: DUF305 domain-containing protein [Gemmatimonadales bacterium]|nr:DUF305 domain-containing protein [Gemmatimonadales bacterium]
MRGALLRSAAVGVATVACLTLSITPVVAQTDMAKVNVDSARRTYTAADVFFMKGMIGHHAQAVLMAGWAPTHGASQSLQALCARIAVGQTDEIHLMQTWLRDRHEEVPAGDATMDMMPGMDESHLMPGMLTADELNQLDKSRGADFDRLFLTFMIKHHQGAITMVNTLFGSQGAGEEETIFRFASNVYADQTTEIDRMSKMLAAMPPSGHGQ